MFLSSVCWIYFLLCSVACDIPISEENLLFPTQEVLVGNNVSFLCNISFTNESLVWYINGTNYAVNELPDDYYISLERNIYVFMIQEAKLWMNNTDYACSSKFQQVKRPLGKLIVNFNFTGPRVTTKAQIGKYSFIDCSSPIISAYNIFVVWKLNGKIYAQSALPQFFYQQAGGLFIHKIKEDMNGTTLQCLLLSNMLLKDAYWSSEIGTLIVSKSPSDPLPICDFKITCHLSSTFKFDYQHFFFSRNEYNISWENATTNVKPIYYLIGSRNGNVVFEENINNLMSYTLTEDLIRNDIHVEARNENTTISKSSQFLRIIPGVTTETVSSPVGKDICLQDIPSSFGVLWPNISRNDECFCSNIEELNACSCVNNTGYTVMRKSDGSVCWRNITKEMNKTKLFFWKDIARVNKGQLYPGVQIYKSVMIIVSEPPDPPTVYSDDSVICIYDNFNGHSEIFMYNINITSNINGKYHFIHRHRGQPTLEHCINYPQDAIDVMEAYCGPQLIMVTSVNNAGVSHPSIPLIVNQSNSNPCDCVKNTVTILVNYSGSTSDSFKLNVSCLSDYNFPIDLMFTFKLENYDDIARSYQCLNSSTLNFMSLEPDSSYTVNIEWNMIDQFVQNQSCIYQQHIGKYKTNRNKNNTKIKKYEVIIIVVSIFAGLFLAVIVILGLVRAALYILKKYRSSGSRERINNNEANS